MPLNPSDDSIHSPQGGSDSGAQREQLLKKLNCLIAVLEAAISKVRRNQQDTATDPDRLERIRINLENTLTICQRAKVTLEKRGMLPANLPPEVREAVGASNSSAPPAPARTRSRRKNDQRMTYRDYVELSSVEEFQKFKDRTPISSEEVAGCDFDLLANQFSALED
ncbi:MAG: hypothetical protein ACKVS6_08185 [Planctomycetota bacterium]